MLVAAVSLKMPMSLCPNIPTPRAGSEHVHHKSNPSWTSGVSVGFRNAVALGPKQNLANVAKLWYYGPM